MILTLTKLIFIYAELQEYRREGRRVSEVFWWEVTE